ncbi:o-succinylbenzoate synthase [Exiguobacterium sp. SH3S2]|uniref:o-succinylbenzoate synthase n=1 Tax=unclassified Exiguobacterium TaxID=2644629 RepID=UPI0010407880|nr:MULTISPECIES: o-succinylbenzoate synthase [unclassified Exiguobacterium]TCI35055.1 o-succinylbenzoate synthase [Exiguobacterium sp. SH4S7]TCI41622.1 o-succinylbenzoate synthase [Exiguobacterium sp. SH3S3]TCI44602.1 o-succinylbenzoate synthase [Exiguobacterium sp. SH5S32]TCI51008.1 o-succinylbenzoate synthase [Exiguobacterium sp. SH1S4]TCI58549.1 o-succinylbenzoate synthase [Exiguobacterium sp. SH3S2]
MIQRADLYIVPLTFKHPLVTAHSVLTTRRTVILRLETTDGAVGYGEGVAFETPWYTSETVRSTVDTSELIYRLLNGQTVSATTFPDHVRSIIGHPMAKAMWESALWEIEAARAGVTLKQLLQAGHHVACGRTIGIGLLTETLNAIEQALDSGFERIKLKASPHELLTALAEVRTFFPDAPLMIDLNGSAHEQPLDWFEQLDAHRLLMIEQPYPSDCWVDSADLQTKLKTPICLDESITSRQDVETMNRLRAGRIVNIKPARVGGLTEALAIRDSGTPYWVGGMYESSIGRYHTLLFASLTGAAYPADMAGTSAYFETDLLDTPLDVENGQLSIPDVVTPDWKKIHQLSEQIIQLT